MTISNEVSLLQHQHSAITKCQGSIASAHSNPSYNINACPLKGRTKKKEKKINSHESSRLLFSPSGPFSKHPMKAVKV